MSHLHFPDGVLPVWLWVLGFIVTFLLLAIFFRGFDLKKNFTRLPLLGLFSAVMFLAMSFELVPIAYHINLSVVAGILLGPSLGFLAAFIVNTFSAFLAHGGITVIGLNTLTVGFEVILGYYLYRIIRLLIEHIYITTFATTMITLFLATIFTIGIVYLGTQDLGGLVPSGQSGGLLRFELGQSEETHMEKTAKIDFSRFLTLVLPLGFIGWIIESTISGALISYLTRERPDILRWDSRAVILRGA